jgi:hypothetical protein
MLLDRGRSVVRELAGDSLAFARGPEGAMAHCPCPRCQGEA